MPRYYYCQECTETELCMEHEESFHDDCDLCCDRCGVCLSHDVESFKVGDCDLCPDCHVVHYIYSYGVS